MCDAIYQSKWYDLPSDKQKDFFDHSETTRGAPLH